MAYLLNSVNLTTYGITPGHATGSNIAVSGIFDMPSRLGKTFHSWGDSHGIEPYVAAGDIFFAGRDIVFYGSIIGTNSTVNNYLNSLYTAIKAFTGLVTFSTPYGNYSVQVSNVVLEMFPGGAKIVITFREPVVTLTGGTLPAVGDNAYTIDAIPFSSFGLYLSKAKSIYDLPENKEQLFTKYGSEGYQITKREHNVLEMEGFIMSSSLADFQAKIKALYLLFKSSGTRNIKIGNEVNVNCFAAEGFNIDNLYLINTGVCANFKANLLCVNVNYINYLLTEASENILTESGEYILI